MLLWQKVAVQKIIQIPISVIAEHAEHAACLNEPLTVNMNIIKNCQ